MYAKYVTEEMAKVWDDKSLFDTILRLEIANAEAWNRRGIVPDEDLQALVGASIDMEVYLREFAQTGHDINSLVRAISATVPPNAGRWVHLGLTSYDVQDTARCKQIRDSLLLIIGGCDGLIEIAKRQAVEHRHTLMMGRTHAVHAEPTTFGQKVAATLIVPLLAHRSHLEKLAEDFRIGKFSGAVGTHANVLADVEEHVCAKLGVVPVPAATQVIDRSLFARYVHTLAELADTLRKFFIDIRLMCQTEVCEVEEPFEKGAVRSSAMPHKRNPERSEQIVGLSYLLPGYAVAADFVAGNWHERTLDTSAPERVYLPDASMVVHYILGRASHVLEGLRVFPERMRANLELTAELTSSGRLLRALAEKGLTRDQSYPLIQELAKLAWGAYQQGNPMPSFLELALADAGLRQHLTEAEIRSCLTTTYKEVLDGVDVTFNRLGLIAERGSQ